MRVIITKQALQEGWDCPFAYVLCALAASHSQSAMTQLVGRILRQPNAMNTPDQLLNECYVSCDHVKTKDVIEAIKAGLERDGMSDIVDQVREPDSSKTDQREKREIARRDKYRTLVHLSSACQLGRERGRQTARLRAGLLYRLDWSLLDAKTLAEKLAREVDAERSHMLKRTLWRERSF